MRWLRLHPRRSSFISWPQQWLYLRNSSLNPRRSRLPPLGELTGQACSKPLTRRAWDPRSLMQAARGQVKAAEVHPDSRKWGRFLLLTEMGWGSWEHSLCLVAGRGPSVQEAGLDPQAAWAQLINSRWCRKEVLAADTRKEFPFHFFQISARTAEILPLE